jgi:hydrogenase expression/formation protein HypE
VGKLTGEELKKLLNCVRSEPRVVVPPMPGYDAGAHLIGDKCLVVATDPCIGVPDDWLGWLLINYAASDVALFGAKPEFCTITLLGPPATVPSVFQGIMKQVCVAADELGMAIVRGHTGTYAGLSKVLGVCTAYGIATKEKLVTPGNAKAGDLILLTKSLGLETLVNFSLTLTALAERLLGTKTAKTLASQARSQSCVKEALLLAEINGVHALHDATEGGVTAALNEVAEASKLGFNVDFEKIPISPEMLTLQRHFRLTDEQILSSSSTGTIIAAVDPNSKQEIEKRLPKIGVSVSYVGTFTREKTRMLMQNGERKQFPQIADDPYERILSGKV